MDFLVQDLQYILRYSPDIHGGTAAAHTVQSIALQAGIEALEPVLVAELGVVTAL